jgi:hypothetical protein
LQGSDAIAGVKDEIGQITMLTIVTDSEPARQKIAEDVGNTTVDTMLRHSSRLSSPTNEILPLFEWSEDDLPIKVWNESPPRGKSGIYFDHEKQRYDLCYGVTWPPMPSICLTRPIFLFWTKAGYGTPMMLPAVILIHLEDSRSQ